MQLGHLKYILVSAFVGAFAWFAILEIYFQANLNIEFGYLWQYVRAIPGIIGIILGTYVGLRTIGRIRKPSFIYGILVGLLSFVLYLPFESFSIWIFSIQYGFPLTMGALLDILAQNTPLIGVIASVVAGLLGTIIVRRISPSFCPYCGNKLPNGRDPCPKCGKM